MIIANIGATAATDKLGPSQCAGAKIKASRDIVVFGIPVLASCEPIVGCALTHIIEVIEGMGGKCDAIGAGLVDALEQCLVKGPHGIFEFVTLYQFATVTDLHLTQQL